jgi:hypothetical protein
MVTYLFRQKPAIVCIGTQYINKYCAVRAFCCDRSIFTVHCQYFWCSCKPRVCQVYSRHILPGRSALIWLLLLHSPPPFDSSLFSVTLFIISSLSFHFVSSMPCAFCSLYYLKFACCACSHVLSPISPCLSVRCCYTIAVPRWLFLPGCVQHLGCITASVSTRNFLPHSRSQCQLELPTWIFLSHGRFDGPPALSEREVF